MQRCRGCPSGPGIAELLQPHSIELGWWSGANCSRFISALRQRHRERKRRLGSPQQLMALSAQMGKSTGEVVGERENERERETERERDRETEREEEMNANTYHHSVCAMSNDGPSPPLRLL